MAAVLAAAVAMVVLILIGGACSGSDTTRDGNADSGDGARGKQARKRSVSQQQMFSAFDQKEEADLLQLSIFLDSLRHYLPADNAAALMRRLVLTTLHEARSGVWVLMLLEAAGMVVRELPDVGEEEEEEEEGEGGDSLSPLRHQALHRCARPSKVHRGGVHLALPRARARPSAVLLAVPPAASQAAPHLLVSKMLVWAVRYPCLIFRR